MSPTELSDERIATELRALRPASSEKFSAELDAWVEAGFPPAPDARPQGSSTPSLSSRLGARLGEMGRPKLLPVLGAAASVLIALVIAVGVLGGTTEESNQPNVSEPNLSVEGESAQPERGTGGAAGGSAQLDSSGESVVAPEPTTVPPSPPIPPQDEKLRPGQQRVQEQSASMTLSTEPDEVDDVADEVIEVIERYDGIVLASNINVNDERGRASFDLRVPTANLQATLADLSDLASVAARDEGTLDITSPFVTAEERFQDAKASVDALLEQLSEADTSSEIAALREQLIGARSELAAARAELGALKQRADFSRLTLVVLGDGDADGWSLGDAADDATNVLEDLAGATLVALAVLIPLGGLALLVWLGINRLRRRQTDRALDQ